MWQLQDIVQNSQKHLFEIECRKLLRILHKVKVFEFRIVTWRNYLFQTGVRYK